MELVCLSKMSFPAARELDICEKQVRYEMMLWSWMFSRICVCQLFVSEFLSVFVSECLHVKMRKCVMCPQITWLLVKGVWMGMKRLDLKLWNLCNIVKWCLIKKRTKEHVFMRVCVKENIVTF